MGTAFCCGRILRHSLVLEQAPPKGGGAAPTLCHVAQHGREHGEEACALVWKHDGCCRGLWGEEDYKVACLCILLFSVTGLVNLGQLFSPECNFFLMTGRVYPSTHLHES